MRQSSSLPLAQPLAIGYDIPAMESANAGLRSQHLLERRTFMALVSSGLLAAPLAADAQQAGKVARIGYLSPLSASADATHSEAFRQGLRDLGYVEGQNAVIEARHADDKFERLPGLAAEIVRLKVDVIVAAPTPAVRAAQQATRTIPIVMAFSGDPVGEGFVAGLARPGGNITGLSATVAEMAAKRVEFLKAIVPDISRVAFLANAATVKQAVTGTEAGGRTLGVQVSTVLVRKPSELDDALSTLKKAHLGGLIVDLTLQEHWRQIVDVALKNRLPTVSGPREFVEAGGLMAYGPHFPDLFRRAATYVDKILKGAKPGDLPIEQPTKFELAINLKTAKALGVTIPQSLLVRADEVIQ
jgi:putative tryptophan/tyrosine transport system substrate-binding protein